MDSFKRTQQEQKIGVTYADKSPKPDEVPEKTEDETVNMENINDENRISGAGMKTKWRIIFMDCEKISDGEHSQFTQIGCYAYQVNNRRRTTFFQPMYPTKNKEYQQMKQKSDLLKTLHLVLENENEFHFVLPNGEKVKASSETSGLEDFLIFLGVTSEGEDNVIFINSANCILPLLFTKQNPTLIQKYVAGVCELDTFFKESLDTGNHLADLIHTDDIYEQVMGKSWRDITPTCAQTAKYMYKLVVKIHVDQGKRNLDFESFVSKYFKPTSYYIEKFANLGTNANQNTMGDQVSLEIENSFRPGFPATVEMHRVVLVDLTGLPDEKPQHPCNAELKKAENAWKPFFKKRANLDPEEELNGKVRSILNKLTIEKFDSLAHQFQELLIDSEAKLLSCVELVFKKAVDEPTFSVAYAHICKVMQMKEVPLEGQDDQFVNFRKLLLALCQREFEKDYKADLDRDQYLKDMNEAKTKKDKELVKQEFEQNERKARLRRLGCIKFIGELYKLQMLTARIMHECVKKLLRAQSAHPPYKEDGDESLECLCQLLITVGQELDVETMNRLQTAGPQQNVGINDLNKYFKEMEAVMKYKKVSARVRFLMQDVIELRLNNWEKRREDKGPKTIKHIRIYDALKTFQDNLVVSKTVVENQQRKYGRVLTVGNYNLIPEQNNKLGNKIILVQFEKHPPNVHVATVRATKQFTTSTGIRIRAIEGTIKQQQRHQEVVGGQYGFLEICLTKSKSQEMKRITNDKQPNKEKLGNCGIKLHSGTHILDYNPVPVPLFNMVQNKADLVGFIRCNENEIHDIVKFVDDKMLTLLTSLSEYPTPPEKLQIDVPLPFPVPIRKKIVHNITENPLSSLNNNQPK